MSSARLSATEAPPAPLPAWFHPAALAALVVGISAFALGVSERDPAPAWRALLVNFLFWASLAQGALVWSAIFRVARATWSAPINRLGHAVIWFLPLPILALGALHFGHRHLLAWPPGSQGDRAWWLNPGFLFLRDGAGLLLLWLVSLAFVGAYLRFESEDGQGAERAGRRLAVLGALLLILYPAIFSLLGFDLVMALTPGWHSGLLGGYFFLGGLYSGLAALIVISVLLNRWRGPGGRLGVPQFHDLGNLLLALAMLLSYFFFSQMLPIWYENLPVETSFVIARLHFQPWKTLSWVVVGVCYLGPFCLLVIREMKRSPRALLAVAAVVFAGMGLERYLLVTPSLAPREVSFPALELLIGLGFAGAFALAVGGFLSRHPAASPLDLSLRKEGEV